jgi:hypothetical protein
MADEKIGYKYSIKQIKDNNNDVPIGTKDKVYSAVVSPSNCCLMMANVWPKHAAAMNNKCTKITTMCLKVQKTKCTVQWSPQVISVA